MDPLPRRDSLLARRDSLLARRDSLLIRRRSSMTVMSEASLFSGRRRSSRVAGTWSRVRRRAQRDVSESASSMTGDSLDTEMERMVVGFIAPVW